MPLNDASIRNALPRDRQYKLYDGNGLFLIVTPKGRKLWKMKYKLTGKWGELAFGRYPDVTLAEARQRARDVRVDLDAGRNPALKRRLARANELARAGDTFADLVSEYLDVKRAKVTPSTWARIESNLRCNALPVLGALPIADITPPLILAVLRRVEARNALRMVEKLRSDLRGAMDFAIATGRFIGANPLDPINSDVLKTRKATSFPTLENRADVGAFLRALADYPGRPETRLCLLLQILTATRPGEARGASWAEFDREEKLWRIPAERMKARVDHVVPLTAQALALLDELTPMTGHSKLLFPGMADHSKSISEMTCTKALKAVWPAYRIVPHGFRALFSTMANDAGHFRPDVIEAALAHSERNAVRAAYNRASYLRERRELSKWWADELDKMRKAAKVVSLARGKAPRTAPGVVIQTAKVT
jgi:integrase